LVAPDPKVDVTVLGHDFAFVPAHQEEGEAVLDRLYVAAADGNQTFAFEFVRGSSTGLELKPVEVYLPMRLFSGKALVAARTRLYYDFGERWIPLLPQRRRRYVTEATLLTPAFDGDEPDCVWHRLMLDGCLPPESGVEIRSRTANDKNDLQRAPWQAEPPLYRRSDGSELPWFPKPKTLNAGTWELLLQRAEGRFLQLRIRLSGNGQSSPIARLRLYYPRSYLKNYLPALYRDDRDSASFLDRFPPTPRGSIQRPRTRLPPRRCFSTLRTAPAETLGMACKLVRRRARSSMGRAAPALVHSPCDGVLPVARHCSRNGDGAAACVRGKSRASAVFGDGRAQSLRKALPYC
jgi:hypothetical protein